MTDTCFIGSLAILINNGNSDLSVLSEENTYTNGTSMSKQVSILKSSAITVDHEVTCKPITDDTDLTERLTRTTPLCKGIRKYSCNYIKVRSNYLHKLRTLKYNTTLF